MGGARSRAIRPTRVLPCAVSRGNFSCSCFGCSGRARKWVFLLPALPALPFPPPRLWGFPKSQNRLLPNFWLGRKKSLGFFLFFLKTKSNSEASWEEQA